jgi:S-adenosylmethionine synthetase
MGQKIARTAEHVSAGHPDKFCDQVADRILDEVLSLAAREDRELKPEKAVLPEVRTAIECLVKDNLLIVSGEVKLTPWIKGQLDITRLARKVWRDGGYGDIWQGGYAKRDAEDDENFCGELTVINHLRSQSVDIGKGKKDEAPDGTGVDGGGAGDQGVMVGYATDETPEGMPREWVLARDLCLRLHELRVKEALPWLRSDCKSQVTIAPDGAVSRVIIAAQHSEEISTPDIKSQLLQHVVWPVLGEEIDKDLVTVNGTGRFVVGGPTGDAGVVGRKIVVDAYGPRVPVGGGAYSGKDPTKVDRSAAYMCRHIARTVVHHRVGGAKECTVTLAYGIGKHEPEMFTAIIDTGEDVSKELYKLSLFSETDLSPRAIIKRLGLRQPQGWSYYQTASYGHYGRDMFPWERPAGA